MGLKVFPLKGLKCCLKEEPLLLLLPILSLILALIDPMLISLPLILLWAIGNLWVEEVM